MTNYKVNQLKKKSFAFTSLYFLVGHLTRLHWKVRKTSENTLRVNVFFAGLPMTWIGFESLLNKYLWRGDKLQKFLHSRQAQLLLYIVFFLLVCVLFECLPWEACLSVCVCTSLSVYSSTVFLGGFLFNILKQTFSNCYTYAIFIKILSAISPGSPPRNMSFFSEGQVLIETVYPKQNASHWANKEHWLGHTKR